MRVLIFGLPGSGKTTLAKELVKKLPCLYLNADKVRKLFDDQDFSMQGRINQARRMRAMADLAPNVLVIADFICPTNKTRHIFKADLSIWMDTISKGRFVDTNKIFEPPQKTDLVIKSKNAKKNAGKIIKIIREIII
jgi:adenylylsulfate kinase